MAYSAEISRANPSAFLFLIDQSGSMDDPFGRQPDERKADGVADAINRLLQNLVIKCTKSEGVRHYFDVGVIGYGKTGAVGPAFRDALAGKYLVPIYEVADSPTRIEERTKKVPDGAGGLTKQTVKVPIWFDAIADGPTPMCEALGLAHRVLKEWINSHPDSYPPIVINITDGQATDGDPLAPAQELMSLSTNDGNVLFFNCHISERDASPTTFPSGGAELPDDEYASLLFQMSSMLPPGIREAVQSEGYKLQSGAKGFAFNADLVEMIRFLDIGTRPSSLQ